jgi:hypothetical protein
METLDLHPEELFDKAAQGLASAEELSRLDAHLASCATCRFERKVRADFDAVGGSTADLDDLVARALSGAKAVPEAPRRRRVGPLLIAASIALMGFGSFAAVAQFTGLLPRLFAERSEVIAPVAPPGLAPRRAAPLPQVEPAPLPEVEKVEEAVPFPPPVEPKPVRRAVERSARPLDSARGERGLPPETPSDLSPALPSTRPALPSTVPPELPSTRPPELPPAPVEPDAITLFSRATQARVSGETATAIRDFRVVVSRYPGSREAALSHAALGRLLLDRGEAASALEAFDAYLGSSDQVLREDVQGARAIALQSLGRVDDERSAWEAVLRDYPSGVFAPRARTRLESLSH